MPFVIMDGRRYVAKPEFPFLYCDSFRYARKFQTFEEASGAANTLERVVETDNKGIEVVRAEAKPNAQ